jgi:hypothetical protein
MSTTNEPWVSPASKLGKEDDLDPLTMAAAKFHEPEDSRARYPSRPHITFTASSNTAYVPSAIPPVNSHRAEQLLKERERRSKKLGIFDTRELRHSFGATFGGASPDTNDLIDADLLRSWDARFAEKHGGSR